MELVYWRTAGHGAFAGVVCAARSVPVEAPGFAAALGVGRRRRRDGSRSLPARGAPCCSRGGGAPLVAVRRADPPIAAAALPRRAVLALALAASLPLLAAGPIEVGAGLALLFLAGGRRALAVAAGARGAGNVWLLCAGPLLLPLGLWLLADSAEAAVRGSRCRRVRPPRLGIFQARVADGSGARARALAVERRVLELVALTALFGAGLAIGAAARDRAAAGRHGMAVFVTARRSSWASLLVSPSPCFPAAIAAAARSLTSCGADRSGGAEPGAARAVPPHRGRRAARRSRRRSVHELTTASFAHTAWRRRSAFRSRTGSRRRRSCRSRRAVERVERFDLARELPAPPAEVDLSDLAYRLWREGEEEAASATLIAYEVFDADGVLRSRFSLIPETDLSGGGDESSVVDRPLSRGGRAPPREPARRRTALGLRPGRRRGLADAGIRCRRGWRSTAGSSAARRTPAQSPRPVLASLRPRRRAGATRARARRRPDRARAPRRAAPVAIRTRYRGEELRGEVRAAHGRLPARRDSRARVPAAAAGGRPAPRRRRPCSTSSGRLVVVWRHLDAAPAARRALAARGAQTFRGRLVALFVLSVMVPLIAVTFFLRSSIATRSRRDTLDHAPHGARDGAARARRLPPVGRGRARPARPHRRRALSWLANAVGFDLSVYSPEARLVATSRRDLYAAGLLPERVPGATLRRRSASATRASGPTPA